MLTSEGDVLSIRLTWTHVTNADEYRVQQERSMCSREDPRRCEGTWWYPLHTAIGHSTHEYTVTDLSSARTYTHRVCSQRDLPNGTWQTACSNEETSRPTPGPTATPTPVPPTATPTATAVPMSVTVEGTWTKWRVLTDWWVLTESDVTVRVEGHNLADYTFNLRTTPPGTGFYVTNGGTGCYPSGRSESGPKRLTVSTQGNTEVGVMTLKLIRCYLGTVTNTGMELVVQPDSGAAIVIMATGRLEQARHRNRDTFPVLFELSSLAQFPDHAVAQRSMRSGSSWWNTHDRSTIFRVTTPLETADVTILHFTRYNGCDDGLACVGRPSDGVYPHIGKQGMWVAKVPEPRLPGSAWTDDIDDARDPNKDLY